MAHKEKMISTLKTKADMIEAEINDLNNFVKNFVEKILKEASGYEDLDTEKFKTKHAQLEYIWNALFNIGINFINFEDSDKLLTEPTLSATQKNTSEWLQKEKQLSMRVSRLEQQTENISRNSNDHLVKQTKKIETQDMKIISLEQQVEFIKNKLGLFSKGPEIVTSASNKVEQNFQFLHQLNPPPNMMNYIPPQFNQVPLMYQRAPTPPFVQGNQTIINQKPMLNAMPQQMVQAPSNMPGINFNLHQQHGMPPANVVPFLPGNVAPMLPGNVASLLSNNAPPLHPGNVAHLLPGNAAQLLPDKANQENEQTKGNNAHLTGTPLCVTPLGTIRTLSPMGESGSTKSSDRLIISPVSDVFSDSSQSSDSSTDSENEGKSKKDNLNRITADGSWDDPPLESLIKERTDPGLSSNLIDSSAVRKKIEELKNFGSMFDKAMVASKGDSEVSGTNTCIDFNKELPVASESQSMQLQAANESSITEATSTTVETTSMKQSRKEVPARYRYTREYLLKLRASPLSQQIPEGLQELSCFCKKEKKITKSIDVSHPGLDSKWNSLKSDVLFYLSRLTVTNVKVIVDELQKINFEVENDLEELVKIIYEKAILDSKNLKAYAQLCLEMSQLSVPISTSSLNISFRGALTKFCIKMFESEKAYFSQLEKMESLDQHSVDEPDKAEQLKKSTRKLKQRRSKFFGNILFCTELCKVGILQPNFIYKCLRYLLGTYNEDSFSVLCQVLENVGSQLDTKGMKTDMDSICDSIIKLADRHPKSRASFLEIIDLRHNNWGLSV